MPMQVSYGGSKLSWITIIWLRWMKIISNALIHGELFGFSRVHKIHWKPSHTHTMAGSEDVIFLCVFLRWRSSFSHIISPQFPSEEGQFTHALQEIKGIHFKGSYWQNWRCWCFFFFFNQYLLSIVQKTEKSNFAMKPFHFTLFPVYRPITSSTLTSTNVFVQESMQILK